MAINLSKGQRVSLDKEAGAPLSRVVMGLGWDMAKAGGMLGRMLGGGGGGSIDLDASCVLFDGAGQQLDAVWFGQKRSKDGSIQHTGDNLTGAGDGDDEQIKVDLSAVPAGVQSIVFTVSSFTGQSFAKVANAFCRIVDDTSGKEVARFDLSCQGEHTAMIMAKLYRHQGSWKLHALGENASGRTVKDLAERIAPFL